MAALGIVGLLVPASESLAQSVEAKDVVRTPEVETPRVETPRVETTKKKTAAGQASPPQGQVFTWQDGGRTLKAYLQSDLILTRDGAISVAGAPVATTGQGRIVRIASAAGAEGHPVFRSSAGTLMTLPGGVLLVFDEAWGEGAIDAFFARNGIDRGSRVSPLGAIPNGFVVATEPGFPSLELANTLAGKDGVRLSSPNWWRERGTR